MRSATSLPSLPDGSFRPSAEKSNGKAAEELHAELIRRPELLSNPELPLGALVGSDGKLKVPFSDWYATNFCTQAHVQEIQALQRHRIIGNAVVGYYLRAWSLLADLEFFVCSIPPLFWGGWPQEAMRIVSMLFLGQYICSFLKDYGNCQRPPCPPLQVLGNPITHKTEYGFPSSHAAHSGIFAYFFYTTICKYVFPGSQWFALFFSLVYLLHIGFSRFYMAMHWRMDVIAGWVIAIVVTALHAAWIDQLENRILNTRGNIFGYVLALVCGVGLSALHPIPKDKCPCYVDSMKFTGVLIGMFFSCWWIYSVNGTLQTRKRMPLFQDTMLSWHFLLELIAGIILAVITKLGTDFISKPLVKHFYFFISGCYVDKLPKKFSAQYLYVCNKIGFVLRNRRVTGATPEPRNPRRNQTPSPLPENMSSGALRNLCEGEGRRTSSSSEISNDGGLSTVEIMHADLQLDPGFLHPSQQWSLLTHRHWWMWEVHCKALSYMMLTISCAFFYPLILRFCWGEEVPQSNVANFSTSFTPGDAS